ncbi:MAG: hypothetical protein KY476_22480 [Planctomycetes bacterium]|nr:hypothetical protein [Planctomycetota bacterium]
MRMLLRAVPILAAGLYLLTPSTAEARRGIVFIQTGNTVKDVGALPPDMEAALEQNAGITDPRVGYLHDRFGVFWLDVWTWNGQWCIYAGDAADVITADQAAQLLGTSADKLSVPFWYRFPPLFVIIVVGGTLLASAAIISKVRSQGETPSLAAGGEEPPPE